MKHKNSPACRRKTWLRHLELLERWYRKSFLAGQTLIVERGTATVNETFGGAK